jgi:hypothetical protein
LPRRAEKLEPETDPTERKIVMGRPLILKNHTGIIPGNMPYRQILVLSMLAGLILCFSGISKGTVKEDATTITTDNGLSLALFSDGRLTSLAIKGQHLPAASGPVLWIMDMISAAQVSAPNLLSNPGLKQKLQSWNPVSVSNTEIDIDSAVSRSGRSSLRIQSLGTGGLGAGTVSSKIPFLLESSIGFQDIF